jgi:hypothetical protein
MLVPLVCANGPSHFVGYRTTENPLPMREIVAPTPSAKITQALWGPLNKYIIYSSEDCSVYIHDPEVRVLLLLLLLQLLLVVLAHRNGSCSDLSLSLSFFFNT